MRIVAVIPCRYESVRLPGKALLAETGKTLIQHVYENALRCRSFERIVIATDDERILQAARAFGAEVQMTSSDHISGTDRIAEAASRIEGDIFVNIQGDEPEIDPASVDEAVRLLVEDEDMDVSTICSRISDRNVLYDADTTKCVIDSGGRALYFSRAPIPYPGADEKPDGATKNVLLQHQGIYCFRRDVLLRFPDLEPPAIERIERLEQLRLLWHGYRIVVCVAGPMPKGIDTREDYDAFLARVGNAGGAPERPAPGSGGT